MTNDRLQMTNISRIRVAAVDSCGTEDAATEGTKARPGSLLRRGGACAARELPTQTKDFAPKRIAVADPGHLPTRVKKDRLLAICLLQRSAKGCAVLTAGTLPG
jgi:hypothetical protein